MTEERKAFFTEITEEQIENDPYYKEMYEEYQRIMNEEQKGEENGK